MHDPGPERSPGESVLDLLSRRGAPRPRVTLRDEPSGHGDRPVKPLAGGEDSIPETAGKYQIQVCRGTACHVKSSLEILETLERELNIRAGQTTRDGLFSLEVVACIGACGQAPVISVNGEFHAKMDARKVKRVLAQYRERAEADDAAE